MCLEYLILYPDSNEYIINLSALTDKIYSQIFSFNSVSVIMRGYAGLAKDAVHIGGSIYDKNGAEISGVF